MQEDLLHHGRWLQLISRNGWEFARRCGKVAGVAIAAATPAGELILVEQFRPPLAARVIELPAGLVGDDRAGEDPLLAAGRELIEETGWQATHLQALCHGPTSAGLSDEVVTLVRAGGLRRVGAGGGVDGEQITVHLIPLAHAADWLQQQYAAGVLVDPKVWAALAVLPWEGPA